MTAFKLALVLGVTAIAPFGSAYGLRQGFGESRQRSPGFTGRARPEAVPTRIVSVPEGEPFTLSEVDGVRPSHTNF